MSVLDDLERLHQRVRKQEELRSRAERQQVAEQKMAEFAYEAGLRYGNAVQRIAALEAEVLAWKAIAISGVVSYSESVKTVLRNNGVNVVDRSVQEDFEMAAQVLGDCAEHLRAQPAEHLHTLVAQDMGRLGRAALELAAKLRGARRDVPAEPVTAAQAEADIDDALRVLGA